MRYIDEEGNEHDDGEEEGGDSDGDGEGGEESGGGGEESGGGGYEGGGGGSDSGSGYDGGGWSGDSGSGSDSGSYDNISYDSGRTDREDRSRPGRDRRDDDRSGDANQDGDVDPAEQARRDYEEQQRRYQEERERKAAEERQREEFERLSEEAAIVAAQQAQQRVETEAGLPNIGQGQSPVLESFDQARAAEGLETLPNRREQPLEQVLIMTGRPDGPRQGRRIEVTQAELDRLPEHERGNWTLESTRPSEGGTDVGGPIEQAVYRPDRGHDLLGLEHPVARGPSDPRTGWPRLLEGQTPAETGITNTTDRGGVPREYTPVSNTGTAPYPPPANGVTNTTDRGGVPREYTPVSNTGTAPYPPPLEGRSPGWPADAAARMQASPEAPTVAATTAAQTAVAAGGGQREAEVAAAVAAELAKNPQSLSQQSSWTQAAFRSQYGANADAEWKKQHAAELARNYRLYGAAEPQAGDKPRPGAPAGTVAAPNRRIGAVAPPGPNEIGRYGINRPRPAAAAAQTTTPANVTVDAPSILPGTSFPAQVRAATAVNKSLIDDLIKPPPAPAPKPVPPLLPYPPVSEGRSPASPPLRPAPVPQVPQVPEAEPAAPAPEAPYVFPGTDNLTPFPTGAEETGPQAPSLPTPEYGGYDPTVPEPPRPQPPQNRPFWEWPWTSATPAAPEAAAPAAPAPDIVTPPLPADAEIHDTITTRPGGAPLPTVDQLAPQERVWTPAEIDAIAGTPQMGRQMNMLSARMPEVTQALPAPQDNLIQATDAEANMLFFGETQKGATYSYPRQDQLTTPEKWAACGPVAAMAAAAASGVEITYEQALAAAKKAGWTASGGMAGPASQVAALQSLGVQSEMGGIDTNRIRQSIEAGKPVLLSSPGAGGHYFVVQDIDAQGRMDLGNSVLSLKNSGGKTKWTLDEMKRGLGSFGQVDTAIYVHGKAGEPGTPQGRPMTVPGEAAPAPAPPPRTTTQTTLAPPEPVASEASPPSYEAGPSPLPTSPVANASYTVDRALQNLDTMAPIDTIVQLAGVTQGQSPEEMARTTTSLANGLSQLESGEASGKWAEPYLNDIARMAWAREERTNGRASDPRAAPVEYIENWKDAYFGRDTNVALVKELHDQVDRIPRYSKNPVTRAALSPSTTAAAPAAPQAPAAPRAPGAAAPQAPAATSKELPPQLQTGRIQPGLQSGPQGNPADQMATVWQRAYEHTGDRDFADGMATLLISEGGMRGAIGDAGRSSGPFQFYWGDRGIGEGHGFQTFLSKREGRQVSQSEAMQRAKNIDEVLEYYLPRAKQFYDKGAKQNEPALRIVAGGHNSGAIGGREEKIYREGWQKYQRGEFEGGQTIQTISASPQAQAPAPPPAPATNGSAALMSQNARTDARMRLMSNTGPETYASARPTDDGTFYSFRSEPTARASVAPPELDQVATQALDENPWSTNMADQRARHQGMRTYHTMPEGERERIFEESADAALEAEGVPPGERATWKQYMRLMAKGAPGVPGENPGLNPFMMAGENRGTPLYASSTNDKSASSNELNSSAMGYYQFIIHDPVDRNKDPYGHKRFLPPGGNFFDPVTQQRMYIRSVRQGSAKGNPSAYWEQKRTSRNHTWGP